MMHAGGILGDCPPSPHQKARRNGESIYTTEGKVTIARRRIDRPHCEPEPNSKTCRYVLLHVTMERELDSNGAGSDFHRAREAYDDAFHRLSVAVHEHATVADVEREYHERRDSLAELIMGADRLRQQRLIVERLAYSLWEQAGYPSGTAESDWYGAEALFRQR
jgi:hypothetical protein